MPTMLELRLPLARKPTRWQRTVRWRNAATALIFASVAGPVATERVSAAGPGNNEIRIGNTMPYSGPASSYGVIGKIIAAYFDKVNAEGGVNGRKINFISYDDAYNPAKTMELTRKLVEEDRVLLTFAGLGTAPGAAVQPYLNSKKVPQLFVASGASMWDRPREFPWTMGWQPSYQTEAHIYAQYLLENYPRGKVAILYQDDGFGKDYVKGLRDGLGGKIPVVAEAAYNVTDTTIERVVAQPAGQRVRSFAAVEHIVECRANKRIVAAATRQRH